MQSGRHTEADIHGKIPAGSVSGNFLTYAL
jgi:hypothetical protein